jgi:hypothetical protein
MVIIETPHFERIRDQYLTDDQYSLLGWYLARRPEADSVIPGSGGMQTLHWPSPGRGKRGGLRVLYYWIAPRGQIVMLTVFRKSELENLTRADIKSWAAVVKKLKS